MHDDHRRRRAARYLPLLAAAFGLIITSASEGAEPAKATGTVKKRVRVAEDDLTFRPTVIVRRGNGQGSGTIIASVDGETLVLTAAHVVRESGPIRIELHRYNLGVESSLPSSGWPVMLTAEVAGIDTAGDVAVVKVVGRPSLPYVARLAPLGEEPVRGAIVTSLGSDNYTRVKSWGSRVGGVAWFAISSSEARDETALIKARARAEAGVKFRARMGENERPFLITERAPEHGRSGGGLFLNGGRLAGVCVGRIELARNQAVGIFASLDSVRRLLRDNDLETILTRSEAVHSRRRN